MADLPFIPQTVRVHLGNPSSDAQNVTVNFPDYIKNVASSELYPTWPENALRANIYAIISFTLNRIYTDWYPSQGYPFDITSKTQYDQAFVNNRDIFENVSKLVDELFNNYIRKKGSVEPFFASYCNGTTVTCNGLSQWGTVYLAREGLTPFEILENYYGEEIEIVENAPVKVNISSYPGIPLRLGFLGNDVRAVQVRLNRIAQNYPSIPEITDVDAVYGPETEKAVKAFQKIFNIEQTGTVGKATWYRIAYIYTSVKRLADVDSEGITIFDVMQPFSKILKKGDKGVGVQTIQYYLAAVALYNDYIPGISVDGYFGDATEEAVIAFQRYYSLSPDGIVGRGTWNALVQAYDDIIEAAPPAFVEGQKTLFPGTFLREGFNGPYVSLLQEYLVRLADVNPAIYPTEVTGYFGKKTKRAVSSFQSYYGYTPDGLVGPVVWNAIAEEYLKSFA